MTLLEADHIRGRVCIEKIFQRYESATARANDSDFYVIVSLLEKRPEGLL